MKQNLKQQLDAWDIELDPLPRFQANVWAEIAARENHWVRFWNWTASLFYNPLPALTLIILALTFSMGAAYVQAQNTNERNGKQMEALYLQSIDPLAHPANH